MEEDLSILYREKSLMDTFYHPDRDHTLHPSRDEEFVALLARGHQDTKPGPGRNKYENINLKNNKFKIITIKESQHMLTTYCGRF